MFFPDCMTQCLSCQLGPVHINECVCVCAESAFGVDECVSPTDNTASSHPSGTTSQKQTADEDKLINISHSAIDQLIDEDGHCASLCVGGSRGVGWGCLGHRPTQLSMTRALHGNKCPFGSCQSELSPQSGPGAKRLNC